MKSVLLPVSVVALAAMLAAQGPQSITIAAPNGTFELRSLRVSKGRGAVDVKGELINHTTAEWGMVSFRVELYDKQGQPLSMGPRAGANTFPVFYVKKDIVTKIDTRMYGDVKGDIARFEILFDIGQYPAVYIFTLVRPSSSPTLAHEDDLVRFGFSIPENRQIAFSMKNKTEGPIKIDWDQTSYVDPDGKSHKVMHQGVRFIERDRPQAASTIPPGATLDDFIYPSDAVTMLSGQWTTPMLFPQAPKAGQLKGTSFSVFMPLEVGGVTKNYNFVFNILDVKM